MAIMAILAITATMAILAITFRNVGADKLLKAHNPSHGLFGLHTKFQSYLATPSCFLWISLQILVIFDQKNIWHTLLGVVYHVKKVSTIFDENWSHNINLKKKNVPFTKKWYENPYCIGGTFLLALVPSAWCWFRLFEMYCTAKMASLSLYYC